MNYKDNPPKNRMADLTRDELTRLRVATIAELHKNTIPAKRSIEMGPGYDYAMFERFDTLVEIRIEIDRRNKLEVAKIIEQATKIKQEGTLKNRILRKWREIVFHFGGNA